MSPSKRIHSVWEYTVRTDRLPDFVAAYAPDGTWARLFRRCPGYLHTELMRDIARPDRFLTIDHWQSHAAFARMQESIADDYRTLDERCERFTTAEHHLGIFQTRSPSPTPDK